MRALAKLDHLSFSSLERLRECPLKFKWTAEGKTPEREFEIAEKGKEIHSILEQWGRGDDEVISALPEKLQKSAKKLLAPFRPAETEFEINVPVSGISFVGYIDWLYLENSDGKTKITIIDHKTGSYEKGISTKESIQLTIYLGLISKIYKFDTGRLAIHRVNLGKLLWLTPNGVSDQPYDFSYEAAQSIYQRLESEVSIAAEQAEFILSQEDVEPTPGRGCQYCPYIFSCPVHYEPDTPPESLAAAYIVESERLKTLKEQIEKFGQIRINDVVVGIVEYMGNAVDHDKVLDVLELIKEGDLTPEDTAEFLQFKSQKTQSKKFQRTIESKVGKVATKKLKTRFDIKHVQDLRYAFSANKLYQESL